MTHLEAIRPVPLLRAVRHVFVPLVPELGTQSRQQRGQRQWRSPACTYRDGDAVVRECEELLAQLVALLPVPLLREELDDLFAADDELVAVPPATFGLQDVAGSALRDVATSGALTVYASATFSGL